ISAARISRLRLLLKRLRRLSLLLSLLFTFFFFNGPTSPEIYTLSLTTLFRSLLRGMALVVMIETHVVNAYLEPESKKTLFFFDSDRKSTRLNSSHVAISYAVFCLKKKKRQGFPLGGTNS